MPLHGDDRLSWHTEAWGAVTKADAKLDRAAMEVDQTVERLVCRHEGTKRDLEEVAQEVAEVPRWFVVQRR